MAAAVTASPQYSPRTDARPTGRQMYAIAYALLDIAGLTAPESRADASELIGRLKDQRTAMAAESNGLGF